MTLLPVVLLVVVAYAFFGLFIVSLCKMAALSQVAEGERG